MRVEMTVPKREIQGTMAVEFEISEGGRNLGTFTIGKASIRWRASKASKTYKGKSWGETMDWLKIHGRTLKVRG
jgi:hypothetical protein